MGEVAGFACAAAKTRSALHSIALSSGHGGDSNHHPPLVNSRWPGGQVATRIYLVGNLHLGGEVARLCVCGGKDSIYRASRWPGGRVASHIYLVGKSTNSVHEKGSAWARSQAFDKRLNQLRIPFRYLM